MDRYGERMPGHHTSDYDVRKTGRVQWDTAPTLNTSHLILGPSAARCALIFIGPTNGHVTLSNDAPVVAENGLVLSATAGVLALDRRTHGDIVGKPWYAIGSAANSVVGWIEIVDLA